MALGKLLAKPGACCLLSAGEADVHQREINALELGCGSGFVYGGGANDQVSLAGQTCTYQTAHGLIRVDHEYDALPFHLPPRATE